MAHEISLVVESSCVTAAAFLLLYFSLFLRSTITPQRVNVSPISDVRTRSRKLSEFNDSRITSATAQMLNIQIDYFLARLCRLIRALGSGVFAIGAPLQICGLTSHTANDL